MIFTIKWLYPYWKNSKYRMIAIVFLGLISASLNAIIPLFIKNIINSLEKNLSLDYLKINVIYLLSLGIISYIINFLAQRNRAYMNFKIEFEVRQKLFSHILTLDHSLYHSYSIGDILTRLIDDISEKISWFACSGVFRFVQSFFTITAVISVMLYLNPILTIWALLPVPLILFFSIKTGKRLTMKYENLQKSITNIYDFLETAFSGIRVIKANSKENSQKEFFISKTNIQKDMEIKTGRLQIIFSYFFHYSVFFSIFLVYIAGGVMVINGEITLGELIAFQFFSGMIIHPLMDISQFFIAGNRAGASIKRINEILSVKSKLIFEKNLEKIDKVKKIELKNLSLIEPKSNKNILNRIDLTAFAGERVAIVGKIGSGKSIILKLIIRLMEYTSGEIFINDIPIRKIDLISLREKISYIPQESSIFSQTILENIILGKNDIKSDEIEKAIYVAQLKDDIDNFPKGLNTKVGNRGVTLSGGEKQRICIARALVRNPEFLLIDDATNAMDANTEENFWNDLNKYYPLISSIIITHRTKTIERSNRIYVIDSGKIVETGNHNELIQKNTLYKKIYEKVKLEEE